MEIEFKREQITVIDKISLEYFESITLESGLVKDDFIMNLVTIHLKGYILSNAVEKKILKYYCPRPTFFDWLFRRTKGVEWELDVRDLMLNPPKLNKGLKRLYIPKQL